MKNDNKIEEMVEFEPAIFIYLQKKIEGSPLSISEYINNLIKDAALAEFKTIVNVPGPVIYKSINDIPGRINYTNDIYTDNIGSYTNASVKDNWKFDVTTNSLYTNGSSILDRKRR